MPRKKAGALVPIGKKIKKVRMQKKISHDRIANETGFNPAYLKEIESGKTIPSVGAILQISRALEIDSGLLLKDQVKDQESAQENRAQAYAKRTDNYAYVTLTPGAENKHLKAFRVTITAMQEHKGVGYQHEGEEFVYVLKGKIEVTVGDHTNSLKKEDSLHFNSGVKHKLRNVGKTDAELLVVIYGP